MKQPCISEDVNLFRFRRRVEMRWSDLDEMRHVNNAVYLTYFEQGRLYYFLEASDWDWAGTGMIQARAEIDYVRPLFLQNNPYLYIRTARLGRTSFEQHYLILDEQPEGNRVIARGVTILVTFDYQQQQPMPLPPLARQRLLDYEKSNSVQQ